MALKRRKENDRRVIDRISDPRLRLHLGQMKWSLLVLTILSGGASLYFFAVGRGMRDISFGIFVGVTLIVLATLVWRYYKSLILFLENESASNLVASMERQSVLWMTITLFSIVFAVVQLVFR